MARSINTSEEEEEEEEEEQMEQGSPSRRVKEDLSEFTKTLSSKLWGVASFLAPSPSSQTPSSHRIYFSADSLPSSDSQLQEQTISGESELMESVESFRIAGIRSDFAEIGGSIKTGIARISNHVAIDGISKMASGFLPLRDEEEEGLEYVEEIEEYEDFRDVIGVTDEVLAFARNIACHPETWLDFPLLSDDDDDDFDDFDMSVAQQDHALAIESLAPRLAALRIELCPTHMSIGCFWKIYFALLHPRLNKHDADLLSTPQIVEARAMLQQGLQSQAKQGSEDLRRHSSFRDAEDGSNSQDNFSNLETEFVDKFVVNEEPYLPNKIKEMALEDDDDDDDDEWPEDETQSENNTAGIAAILACDEEDISFSDLEEDDYCFTKQDFSRIVSFNSENTLNK